MMKLNNQLTTSEKEDNNNHVYMYIHTYMEKRRRKDNSKNTNVVFYDGLDLSELKEIAFRNDTDVSSIVSNLIREFILLFKSETPQKTLFNFDETEPGISFDIENSDLKRILLAKSNDEFKCWGMKLEEINAVYNKVDNQRN